MIRVFRHFIPKLVSVLVCIEIIITICSLYLGAALHRLERDGFFSVDHDMLLASAILVAAMIALSMSALGMYHIDVQRGMKKIAFQLVPSLLLGVGITSVVFYTIPSLYIDHTNLYRGLAISAFLIFLLRAVVFSTLRSAPRKSRIIILGTGQLAEQCSRIIRDVYTQKFELVGFIPMPMEQSRQSASNVLASTDSLVETVKKYGAREIIVSVQNRREGGFPIQELLQCRVNGIKVTTASAFFEREANQIRVDSLHPSWLVFNDGFDQSLQRAFVKRAFDLVVAIVMLVLSMPIMALTALLIYAEDRYPVLYRQQRVGKDGAVFSVLKFRSMRSDAEKDGQPLWAMHNDARTTKIGRWLRKSRIDELPQLINVIKGEMSFVGPRPERPHFVRQLANEIPYYDMRHSIKPGLTGFAQVRYAYGASVEDAVQKLQYDLYYVKNNSLFLDVLILIDTVQVVLFGKGSR